MNRGALAVLVVEDHPTIARQIVDFLDGLKWQTDHAASGALAIDLAMREGLVKVEFVEIVEEDPADTARLLAVLQEEVLVAPALEARMQAVAERRQCIVADLVEVTGIGFIAVVGRQVHAAAEPPDRILAFGRGFEEAHVHVHGGRIRITRMQHQRHAHRFPGASRQFRPRSHRRRWQAFALHVREIAAAALEHIAFLDQARDAAATFGAFPGVDQEGLAIHVLQRLHDARLQVEQPGLDGRRVRGGHVGWGGG